MLGTESFGESIVSRPFRAAEMSGDLRSQAFSLGYNIAGFQPNRIHPGGCQKTILARRDPSRTEVVGFGSPCFGLKALNVKAQAKGLGKMHQESIPGL